MRVRSGRSRRRLLAAALVPAVVSTVLAVGAVSAPVAAAVPNVPQAPQVLFTENFEHGTGAAKIQLPAYTGAPPENMTYTADPAWLSDCNGWIASPQQPAGDPPGSNCGGFYDTMRGQAGAMGQFAGGGAANHALAGGTAFVGPGLNNTILRTVSPISVPANRFLTVSVDAGAVGCSLPTRADVHLLNGSTPSSVFASPVNPCANPQASIGGVALGTYVGTNAVLFTGSAARIEMINRQDGDGGNDAVYDNLKILDVSPTLDKTFGAATVPERGSVTLTYTVTNTTELGSKPGWGFTDTAPAGMRFVPSSVSNGCGGASLGGTTSVTFSGRLLTGQVSCTLRVTMTANAPGSYSTCAANLTSSRGLNPPGCANVYFNAEPDVAPGGPYAGQEGTPVPIAGVVTDVDGPSLSHTWTIAPASGVDTGTSCSFGDPAALSTTVTCDDDGTFTLTLTGRDGFNPPIPVTTTLTLSNVAPSVSISSPANGSLFVRGTPVTFTAPFTDVGSHDTHTCTVDLVDGGPPAAGTVTEVPGSGTCVLTHSFTKIGPHNVLVRVTDDDGDAATAVVKVVIYLPGEAFALHADGLVDIPKTPLSTCPPDEAHTVAILSTPVGSVTALHSSCTLDTDDGTTVAHASVGGARLLGGVITITEINSTCTSSAEAITRTSTVGTINGIPIGGGTGTIGIPGVATVHYNETTTVGGKLAQHAIRVRTLLGQEIILAGCRLG